MSTDTTITESAQAMIDRYGRETALEQARKRADDLSKGGDLKSADMAYRVLNEVERLAGQGAA